VLLARLFCFTVEEGVCYFVAFPQTRTTFRSRTKPRRQKASTIRLTFSDGSAAVAAAVHFFLGMNLALFRFFELCDLEQLLNSFPVSICFQFHVHIHASCAEKLTYAGKGNQNSKQTNKQTNAINEKTTSERSAQ
jgi:hypothetical protein